MKLYIPGISEEIRLTADWTFKLFGEDRNYTLMEYMKDPRPTSGYQPNGYEMAKESLPCTIPAGTVLKIDRIYIKKGYDEYSSLTFFMKDARTTGGFVEEDDWNSFDRALQKCTRKKMVKVPRRPVRFWAKLEDVNNIEFDPV